MSYTELHWYNAPATLTLMQLGVVIDNALNVSYHIGGSASELCPKEVYNLAQG